ncbi:helix-turn-helix transcriptional regulator [Clostridioides sp. ES-S-0108-01]|uniref:helix-turn-helix domain-containing protein n=1 Tax=Clostridioides sp. ES-S-0108-01 TaxID=2770773 RepID=UPI001D0C965E
MIYIEENYKKITLGEVAEEFHFHPNYLSTLIKKTTGKSFKNIIHEQRIKKAVTLLKNTDMNIEDISIEVGYNNQTFFYKKFKELYGMTPQIYRIKSNLLLREVSCEKIYS